MNLETGKIRTMSSGLLGSIAHAIPGRMGAINAGETGTVPGLAGPNVAEGAIGLQDDQGA